MTLMTDRFQIGRTYQVRLMVDQALVEKFAEFSGDRNPIHVDSAAANAYGYSRQVAHGAILIALLSKAIGMEIPGPGALWMNQTVEWLSPVYVGDEIELTVMIEKISTGASILTLDITAMNQKGKNVMKGKASVKVGEKIAQNPSSKKKTVKTALITGSSRGMGAAIARRFAEEGWHVALHYHKAKCEAENIAKILTEKGVSHSLFQADLSDEKQFSGMLSQVSEIMGDIDIVVHGASPMVQAIKIQETSYQEFEKLFRVYIGGANLLISRLAPGMIERKFGRFIFLGTSFMFGIPPTGLAPYISAKEALWGLVKCAAGELGPFGITANMVSPSMMITDFTADIPARLKELEARKSPVRRLATVEDAAEAVAFLARESASYVNGANIPVAGGPV